MTPVFLDRWDWVAALEEWRDGSVSREWSVLKHSDDCRLWIVTIRWPVVRTKQREIRMHAPSVEVAAYLAVTAFEKESPNE